MRYLMLVGFLLLGCGDSGGPNRPGRSYRMGFSAIPPKMDTALLLPPLQLASQHSDAGLIQLSIPWDVLLMDTAAATEVRIVRLPLVNYYRGSGKQIVVALDVTNGLDRSAEDPILVNLGRSITDTVVQRLYREYVSAVDSILTPDYMSLAAETNPARSCRSLPPWVWLVPRSRPSLPLRRGTSCSISDFRWISDRKLIARSGVTM